MANDNFHHQYCGCWLHRADANLPLEMWEKGAEETRKSLVEGNGITSPNAKEAIEWLKQGDTTDKTGNTSSH